MGHFDFPIFLLRVPRYMNDGDITLRPLRIFDRCAVNSGLRDDDILRSGGLTGPLSGSWISIWWWLKKTYVVSYCIESSSDLIGFIGLYNMSPDRSAEISLAIFDKGNRRLGYGTRAFHLLTENLRQHPPEIRARVKAANHGAISFWSKLGFREIGNIDDERLMSMDLTGDRG